MREIHFYGIAGFTLSVSCPAGWDPDRELPSFRPFRRDGLETSGCLMRCGIFPVTEYVRTETEGTPLEETSNDMGTVRLYSRPGQYVVELDRGGDGPAHYMTAVRDFSDVRIYAGTDGRGHAVSSLVRIAYSQAILGHDAVAVHASAVFNGGVSYLFMGRSGTGKSTHARLWMEHIPGTGLLNDDNPTVRIVSGKAYAFGTPWSGKTPCYRPLSFPVGGMVRLYQSPENRYIPREGADAFVTVFPGCSAICSDSRLRSLLYDTVSRLAETVTVGRLDCRADREAALLCRRSLAAEP